MFGINKSNKRETYVSFSLSDGKLQGGFFDWSPQKRFKYGTGPTPPISNWSPPNIQGVH